MSAEIPSWNRCKLAPCICRILAKNPGRDGRVMTDAELRRKTGWNKNRLRRIYNSGNWKDITDGDKDLFLWACRLNPSEQRRYFWMLKRALKDGIDGIRKMRHLRIQNAWQANQVNTLLRMVERVLENEQRNGS